MIRVDFDPTEWADAEAMIRAMPKAELRDVATKSYGEIAVEATPEELANLELKYGDGTATITAKEEGFATVPSDIPVALRIARRMAAETGRAPVLRLQQSLATVIPNKV